MLKLMIILFFLPSLSQSTQENQTSNGKDCAPLSNPELKSLQPSLEIEIGQNVTLSCLCTNGALPINYTFFRNQSLLSIITMKDRNPALHNLTINSASDLGEYKCKAENRNVNSSKYSTGLTFTFLDPVSKPVLSATTSYVKMGQNVTLFCHSENGSFPIDYMFFQGNRSISRRIPVSEKAKAVLNITINSPSDLGNYKCKAKNKISNHIKYSSSLNFTLAEENDPSYLLCIFLGLLFLLVVIAIALLIPFWILPWCKARKLKSAGSSRSFVSTEKATGSENYVTYTEIEYAKSEEMEYANVLITGKEDNRKVNIRADTTIVYSEIIRRDEMQAEPRHSPE
ncbi:allergin-1 [Pelodiscus sinensis]|uniref:allergin-1 n=1 Tax=Pelodiscus sinensis TaxID=13735 RepID=UPI003F6BF643